jgi:hypothetical protein
MQNRGDRPAERKRAAGHQDHVALRTGEAVGPDASRRSVLPTRAGQICELAQSLRNSHGTRFSSPCEPRPFWTIGPSPRQSTLALVG